MSVLGGQTLHYIKDPTKLEAALDQMRLQAAWTSTHSSNYCISESVCVGEFSHFYSHAASLQCTCHLCWQILFHLSGTLKHDEHHDH